MKNKKLIANILYYTIHGFWLFPFAVIIILGIYKLALAIINTDIYYLLILACIFIIIFLSGYLIVKLEEWAEKNK